jgi:hypothetical protein
MSDSAESTEPKPPEKPMTTAAPSITVSFPLGLFGYATMNVPTHPAEDSSISLPVNRELLDMPNMIPAMEGVDDEYNLDNN